MPHSFHRRVKKPAKIVRHFAEQDIHRKTSRQIEKGRELEFREIQDTQLSQI